jgi:hypothetical protein
LDFGICSPYKFDKSGGEAFVFAPVKPNFIEFFQYARFSTEKELFNMKNDLKSLKQLNDNHDVDDLLSSAIEVKSNE